MSTAMNFGTKSFQPRPPEKGSFPLDHFAGVWAEPYETRRVSLPPPPSPGSLLRPWTLQGSNTDFLRRASGSPASFD
ncbi:hypothetical protein P7K49_003415 [Saguinus oedipus]|uniref:Uncharacterized protein n=1 Tax=Saguinus oedipus TaxID=9490 RepID=A0ABQ9W650_SAGOE|nr:hypothetical protein P7K49_003415 [Saguinus oedipus]